MSTLMSKLMSQSIENIFVSVENDCNFNTGTGTSLVSLSATSPAPVRCEQTSDFFEMGVIDQENGNSTTQRVLLCIKAKNSGEEGEVRIMTILQFQKDQRGST